MKYITKIQSKYLKTRSIAVLVLLSILISCNDTNNEIDDSSLNEAIETLENNSTDKNEAVEEVAMDPRSFGGEKAEDQLFIDEQAEINLSNKTLGSYVGAFGNNMINIMLYKMESGTAEGYSVCAGNFRKITGTYKTNDIGLLTFILNEPGDDQYDGAFEFNLLADENSIAGVWIPFNKKGNSTKEYVLTKKEYHFDINNGDHTDASLRLLTEDDVNNLDGDELGYMRNCIYARHGYSFKDKMYRGIFEKKDWYMPTCIDVRDKLTDTEVQNIALIYEYEEYFEMYYDDYGR